MSQPTERVAARCPSCSTDEPTAHELLKEGGLATVRCTECGHVHKTELTAEETIERRVVVSQEDESFTAQVEVDPERKLKKGEEFLLDTEEAILTVRITDLEYPDGQRHALAEAEDVGTIWTRAVGNVAVNLTLHPKDGRRDETRSLKIQVPGDEEFTVGATSEYGGEEFTVEGIVIRDDAISRYDFEQLDHDRDTAQAKDIKRLYARDESSTAWSAW
ncbi:HVO_0476 family zinc finger protein [Natronomonas sp. EA1]|uniref:HVO_0476 family zinc finger protein n=1 Tax=Natronomonas sp. EA1 TaxID=3421655 RepID=UPI003EBDE735